MADQDAQDRNLPASARKLRKAREDGQIARSRDLGHFALLGTAALLLSALAPTAVDGLRNMLAKALQFDAQDLLEPDVMLRRLEDPIQVWLVCLVLAGGTLALAGIGAALASGGWLWTFKTLAPRFDKFNPVQGLGRVLSRDQMVETLKASVIALGLVGVGTLYLHDRYPDMIRTLAQPLPLALAAAGELLMGALLRMVLVLALFAAIDWPLQRWRLGQRLKMSREEVRQEHKEQEGNPEVKGRQRARMREVANRRMLQAVPSADLVVMNPTHYAVALKYDEARAGAPRVVAKGADLMAMRIRDAAQGAKVPVLQAPVLARALYAHAELDHEIPVTLYTAVAQVLAYVFQLRAAAEGRGTAPNALPELNIPPELDPHQARGTA